MKDCMEATMKHKLRFVNRNNYYIPSNHVKLWAVRREAFEICSSDHRRNSAYHVNLDTLETDKSPWCHISSSRAH